MSGIVATQTITLVTIVTNNYLLRLGLQKLADEAKSIRLVGHAAHSDNLDEILTNEQPHIVILDTEVVGGAPELIRKIKRAAPRIKTILLSGFDDIEYSRQALASGADGIVLKVQPSAILLATINYLAHSHKEVTLPIDNAPTQLQLNHSSPILAPPSHPFVPSKCSDGLTEREREVVRLIGEGLSNKDIADRLCISSITVRHPLTSIFDKLGVSNRQKLLIRAHQQGLARSSALA